MPGPLSYPTKMGRRIWTGNTNGRHQDCPEKLNCVGIRCKFQSGKTARKHAKKGKNK